MLIGSCLFLTGALKEKSAWYNSNIVLSLRVYQGHLMCVGNWKRMTNDLSPECFQNNICIDASLTLPWPSIPSKVLSIYGISQLTVTEQCEPISCIVKKCLSVMLCKHSLLLSFRFILDRFRSNMMAYISHNTTVKISKIPWVMFSNFGHYRLWQLVLQVLLLLVTIKSDLAVLTCQSSTKKSAHTVKIQCQHNSFFGGVFVEHAVK